jgi:glyoxalase family protein
MTGAAGGTGGVNGIHHITAIAGPPQENVDFYAGVLGLRLVKRTVNQDTPSTYHLFYADAAGHTGSTLTFFPWPHLPPQRTGYGMAVEVGLEIPPDSLSFWHDRFQRYGVRATALETRFGERVLPLSDPHGLPLVLVEGMRRRPFAPWDGGPVSAERQIRGLHGTQLWERDFAATSMFLTSVLGFELLASESGWSRFGFRDYAGVVDLREMPNARRGSWGTGSVHHLAWRVADEAHQAEVRTRVELTGAHVTGVIDRFWFKSVYFKEPGGVLFELATDGPGFDVDEDASRFGERLVLPPWLEGIRATIERDLPPLRPPPSDGARRLPAEHSRRER